MTFNQSAVNQLFDSVVSKCMTLGVYETVNQHEPKSAPQNGITASIWIDSINPVGRGSGLNNTSGTVVFNIRAYSGMLSLSYDLIDPKLMTAIMTTLDAFSGGFTFGNTVRDIDLLGMYGASMKAQAGYINVDSKMFRIMTITLPVIINDLFSQVP